MDVSELKFYFLFILNIFFKSINSKTLFIIVEESIEIFFPIFQLGCFVATLGLIFAIFFFDLFKKGPPDAVKTILSIVSFFSFAISFQIEKCSESIGMKFVLYFNNFFEINSQPQIMMILY